MLANEMRTKHWGSLKDAKELLWLIILADYRGDAGAMKRAHPQPKSSQKCEQSPILGTLGVQLRSEGT
jgi:hypothetical protein